MGDVLKELKLVASEADREGHVVLGAVYRGVFLPLGVHPLGFVEDRVKAALKHGGPEVESDVDAALQGLDQRITEAVPAAKAASDAVVVALEGRVAALEAKLAGPPAAAPAAPADADA